MKELPAHPDAADAMRVLVGAGVRVIALTNGSASATEHLVGRAGLGDWIERILSVEEVKRSKPRAAAYRHAAGQAGVDAGAMALVAAHPWDIHGAKQAVWSAADVARGVPFPSSVMRKPDVEGASLSQVAHRLAELAP